MQKNNFYKQEAKPKEIKFESKVNRACGISQNIPTGNSNFLKNVLKASSSVNYSRNKTHSPLSAINKRSPRIPLKNLSKTKCGNWKQQDKILKYINSLSHATSLNEFSNKENQAFAASSLFENQCLKSNREPSIQRKSPVFGKTSDIWKMKSKQYKLQDKTITKKSHSIRSNLPSFKSKDLNKIANCYGQNKLKSSGSIIDRAVTEVLKSSQSSNKGYPFREQTQHSDQSNSLRSQRMSQRSSSGKTKLNSSRSSIIDKFVDNILNCSQSSNETISKCKNSSELNSSRSSIIDKAVTNIINCSQSSNETISECKHSSELNSSRSSIIDKAVNNIIHSSQSSNETISKCKTSSELNSSRSSMIDKAVTNILNSSQSSNETCSCSAVYPLPANDKNAGKKTGSKTNSDRKSIIDIAFDQIYKSRSSNSGSVIGTNVNQIVNSKSSNYDSILDTELKNCPPSFQLFLSQLFLPFENRVVTRKVTRRTNDLKLKFYSQQTKENVDLNTNISAINLNENLSTLRSNSYLRDRRRNVAKPSSNYDSLIASCSSSCSQASVKSNKGIRDKTSQNKLQGLKVSNKINQGSDELFRKNNILNVLKEVTIDYSTKGDSFNDLLEKLTGPDIQLYNIAKVGTENWLQFVKDFIGGGGRKKCTFVDICVDFDKIYIEKQDYVKQYLDGNTKVYRINKDIVKKVPKQLEIEEYFDKISQPLITEDMFMDTVVSQIPLSTSYVPDDNKSQVSSCASASQRNYLKNCIKQIQDSNRYGENLILEVDKKKLMDCIYDVFFKAYEAFNKDQVPRFKLRNNVRKNVIFQDGRLQLKSKDTVAYKVINFNNSRSRFKFCLMLFILAKSYSLLENDTKLTKREIFYQIKHLVRNQHQVDDAIADVSSLLNVGPWHLNIVSHRGLVYGDLKLLLSTAEIINCNVPGTLIPIDVDSIIEIKSNAKFILVVEKESIFHKLLSEDLPNKLSEPFIMITGKGVPDFNTQLFLKKLSVVMSVPVFLLVDADVYGVRIMMNYRFGSFASCHLSQHLAVPKIRWLGVFPSDIEKYKIKHSKLTSSDKKLINNLLSNPCLDHHRKIADQLKSLLEGNKKAAIEGLIKTNTFLSGSYLQSKFRQEDFI